MSGRRRFVSHRSRSQDFRAEAYLTHPLLSLQKVTTVGVLVFLDPDFRKKTYATNRPGDLQTIQKTSP